jgi:hypothetical protein
MIRSPGLTSSGANSRSVIGGKPDYLNHCIGRYTEQLPPASQWYQSQTQPTLGITPIIWMEIIGGGHNKVERLRGARLLKQFDILYFPHADGYGLGDVRSASIRTESWNRHDGLPNRLGESPVTNPLIHITSNIFRRCSAVWRKSPIEPHMKPHKIGASSRFLPRQNRL